MSKAREVLEGRVKHLRGDISNYQHYRSKGQETVDRYQKLIDDAQAEIGEIVEVLAEMEAKPERADSILLSSDAPITVTRQVF